MKLNGRDENGFTPAMRRHYRAAVAMHGRDNARGRTGHEIAEILMTHTVTDAMETLGVSRNTVKRMRHRVGIIGAHDTP